MDFIRGWLKFDFKRGTDQNFFKFARDFYDYLRYILWSQFEILWYTKRDHKIAACIQNLSTGYLGYLCIAPYNCDAGEWVHKIRIQPMANTKNIMPRIIICNLHQIRNSLFSVTSDNEEIA